MIFIHLIRVWCCSILFHLNLYDKRRHARNQFAVVRIANYTQTDAVDMRNAVRHVNCLWLADFLRKSICQFKDETKY